VKFNRRGAAAFRTVTLIGDHELTWLSPKDEGDFAAKGEAKSKGNLDLRELLAVRAGEAPDPAGKPGEHGSATLRLYAAKHADGRAMQANGNCLCLVFANRTVDIGTDSTAHRDFLLTGFSLLSKRGPSGGRLIAFSLKKKGPLGYDLKVWGRGS
jgi:hypothetical protein